MKSDFYEMHLLFTNFMQEKGYSVRSREKLISPIFPTTFTMSGGPDLAYKFAQGDTSLVGNHIVNQPCVRHWDIDLSGDGKHLSFFNMFVAESIQGFSREEVIVHFWEFFIHQMGLDPHRIYATYFNGGDIKGSYFAADKEMAHILFSLGIPETHIISSSDHDPMQCFVANTVEPVGGPRAEFFYDIRETSNSVTSSEEFWQLEEEGHLLEFFTHVLYNVAVSLAGKNGEKVFSFQALSHQAIAAGFGPQRLMKITEGVENIDDISILASLKNCLGEVPPQFQTEATVVCDHIRGLVFLINDGAFELHGNKNRGRRYLFRKYIQHFKCNYERLPIENKDSKLSLLVNESIDLFKILFPNFETQRESTLLKFRELYQRV